MMNATKQIVQFLQDMFAPRPALRLVPVRARSTFREQAMAYRLEMARQEVGFW